MDDQIILHMLQHSSEGQVLTFIQANRVHRLGSPRLNLKQPEFKISPAMRSRYKNENLSTFEIWRREIIKIPAPIRRLIFTEQSTIFGNPLTLEDWENIANYSQEMLGVLSEHKEFFFIEMKKIGFQINGKIIINADYFINIPYILIYLENLLNPWFLLLAHLITLQQAFFDSYIFILKLSKQGAISNTTNFAEKLVTLLAHEKLPQTDLDIIAHSPFTLLSAINQRYENLAKKI